MPILLLSRPIAFPVALLRTALSGRVPMVAWRVGDEDFGTRNDVATLDRPQTILGRTQDAMILISVELRQEEYRPANGHLPPRHAMHVAISRPSIDNDDTARLIALIIGATLAMDQDNGASLQLEPGENWLAGPDMLSLLRAADNDPGLTQRALLGTPERFDGAASVPAPAAQAAPPREAAPEPADSDSEGKKSLATFTMLLDGDVHIDWPRLDEVMRAIDPEGNWHSVAIPAGMGCVLGRARIMVLCTPCPMDSRSLDSAFQRSFWFDGDRARVARHRNHITLHIESPDDYAARLATAKVATLVIGGIAMLPQCSAVFNHEVQTIFSPEMTRKQVGILHTDEVPITLWTWTAPNKLEDGDVCLTTGGFEPFLGYEVEVWNAPHPVDFVADKLSETLRYLLINGPVINHGDTIGAAPGDKSIRCFFGDSKVGRHKPMKAMFLEFDAAAATAAPKKDLPLPASIRPPATPQPQLRRVGGFGRKGL